MHVILGRKPQINPVSTASSIAGFKKRIDTEIEEFHEKSVAEPPIKKAKTKNSNQPEWLKQLKEESAARYKENKESRAEAIGLLCDLSKYFLFYFFT